MIEQYRNNKDSESVENSSSIDFGAIYDSYKRYWWLFAISIVACIAMATLYLYVKKPVYLVNAKVLISDEENSAGATGNLLKSFGLGGSGPSVDDEVIVISAQSICKEMVSQLKLNRTYKSKSGLLKSREYYNDSPIEINAPKELFDTLTHSLKFNIKVNDDKKNISITVNEGIFSTIAAVKAKEFPVIVNTIYGNFIVNTTKFYKSGDDLNIKARVTGDPIVAEKYLEDLTIDIISKKANGINMNLDETNIRRGKDVLNKIIEIYNKRGQKEKDETAINTANFIDERLNIIYNELSKSELAIESYKKQNKFIDLQIEAEYEFTKNKEIDSVITELETQISVLQMIEAFLNDPSNNNSLIPFNAEFSIASEAVEQYNTLVLERQKIAFNSLPNNIALKAYDEQINSVRKNVILSLSKSIASINIRLDKMRNEENVSGKAIKSIPSQEREFLELRRQQQIKNTLYAFLLQKKEENELVIAASTPKGKIVDSAFAYTEPISPNILFVIILTIFMGGFIPVAILYLKNLFSNKFSSIDELERIVKAPVIGELCHNRHKGYLVVKPNKTSSIVELFRLIRNNLQFMLPGQQDKLILITSSVSGEGKSFVSTNLAASFALLEKRVLLIGLDIRSPKLAEYLKLKSSPGATNFLADDTLNFEDLVQHSEIENLDVIVAGPIPPNPSELLLRDRVAQLFDTAKEKYDYVIVDSAPVAMVSDTFSIAGYANSILYVSRANYTQRSYIKYLNQLIGRRQLSNVAVVINDTNPKTSQGYGYGYGDKKED